MIFVTLGSQKFQFNRLLKVIDELIETGKILEDVFAQIGVSDYIPRNYKYQMFLNCDEFAEIMDLCDIVITHGGTGAIIGAVKKKKKVIAVPRLKIYKEHVDDHQIQLLREFDKMEIIEACYELDDLNKKLVEVKNKEYKTYQSNTFAIINSIDAYINSGILKRHVNSDYRR